MRPAGVTDPGYSQLFPRFARQEPRARLEDPLPALLGVLHRFFLLRLQIRQIRSAEGTGDRLQMEAEIIHQVIVKRFEQVASQLFARRAAEPFAPPDGADRMFA